MKNCGICTQPIPPELAQKLHKIRSEKAKAVHVRRVSEGVTSLAGKPRTLPYDEIFQLYNQGWSTRKIAKKYGTSPSAIGYSVRISYREKQKVTSAV